MKKKKKKIGLASFKMISYFTSHLFYQTPCGQQGKFVTNVLPRRRNDLAVRKFLLNYPGRDYEPLVTKAIDYASSHDVQHLSIHLEPWKSYSHFSTAVLIP